jgi:hypothetical protein
VRAFAAVFAAAALAACGTSHRLSLTPPPVLKTRPTVTFKTVRVGEPLRAASGTWSPTPSKYAYVWERCSTACVTVSTSVFYTVSKADLGSNLVLIVSAYNANGWSAPVPSTPALVVP